MVILNTNDWGMLMLNNKIAELISEIETELSKLKNNLLKQVNDEEKYIKRLEKNLQFVKWVNNKFKISTSKRKYTVAQKEIYYCDLGINIGSEQGENRPVVILQNNYGNKSGNTTIIAPITSHEQSVLYDDELNKPYLEVKDKNGNLHRKYLDYYEIPIAIENNNICDISGFVNVAHIREIDRKRICSKKVAIITNDCFIDIKKAISKNLR